MKIYLLNPPFLKNFVRCGRWQGVTARGGTLDYPKWLAYTAGILEKEGHIVKLRDAIADDYSLDDVVSEVGNFKPDMTIVETNFSSLNNDIGVIESIKSSLNGEIISVVIGPTTAVYPDEIIKNDFIDIIVRFEPDLIIQSLVKVIDGNLDLRDVDGIWFKENDNVFKNADRDYSTSEELDELPFVSSVYKNHLNIKRYYLSQSLYPEVQIFSGRGCPFKCTFCSWPENLMGRKVRLRSAENIFKEFQYIAEELPYVKEIFIEDDTFTLNKKRVHSFCNLIIANKLKVKWSCNARADLDYETLCLMKKAGCRLIIVGYESGSDEILKSIKKSITIERAKIFSKDAKKAGLLIHGDFIIGLPGETHETAKETYDYIKEIQPDILQVAIATPIPGTEFYNYVKEQNYLLVDDMTQSIDENGYQKCIVSYPDFSKDDIEHWVNKILKDYYVTPRYIPIFLSGICRGGGFQHVKSVFMSGIDFVRYIISYN